MPFAFYFKLLIPPECRPFSLDTLFNESALDRFQDPLGNTRTPEIAGKMGIGKKHHACCPKTGKTQSDAFHRRRDRKFG